MKKIVIIFVALCFYSFSAQACTQSIILGPLGPGLEYIDGSNPIMAIHKNMGSEKYFYVLHFKKGEQGAGGTIMNNYQYEHDFIVMGRDWDGTKTWDGSGKPPFRSSTAMNVLGSAFQVSNSLGGEDYPDVREAAAGLPNDFEELHQVVGPESYANKIGILGYQKNGDIGIGYVDSEKLTSITPQNPFYIVRVDAASGRQLMEDTKNWFHGDPDKLEARDVAYIWHRFNTASSAACLSVLKQKIMWCTASYPKKSPFIPFDLNDPYVYEKFQDGSYYESASYSLQEIDDIEDKIMAPDGSVIGDVRDIQMRIAEGLPIQQTIQCMEGDVNCDNKVDLFDLIVVARDFGKTSDFDEKADLNNDGQINLLDLIVVARNFGKSA